MGQVCAERHLMGSSNKAHIVDSLVAAGSVSGLVRTPKSELEPTGHGDVGSLKVRVEWDTNFFRSKKIHVKAVDGRPIQRQPERVHGIGIDQIGVTKSKRL